VKASSKGAYLLELSTVLLEAIIADTNSMKKNEKARC